MQKAGDLACRGKGSDFFHLFGNGTGTSSIGKNSVVVYFNLGKKRYFPLKLGKFHYQSENWIKHQHQKLTPFNYFIK